MQWSFFRITVTGGEEALELNKFLRTVLVLNVHREFVSQGDGSFWAIAVEYLPATGTSAGRGSEGNGKTDFRAILSPADFTLFARLREWRKAAANSEAVPVYTIFTNEQLAEMARRRCSSKAALGEIDGIGAGRIEKYGEAVLELIAAAGGDSSGKPL